MILVYTHKVTNRINYTFQTVFEQILKTPVSFTDDVDFYLSCKTAKLSYTTKAIDDGLHFTSTNLLFEDEIKPQNTTAISQTDGTVGLFKTPTTKHFNFDVFASIFYLTSRYEEYLPHQKDKHERFLAIESFAFKNNCLELPMVNIWVEKIAQLILTHFPNYKFPERKFEFLSTIDIDNAFAIKHKGFWRTIGGLAKSITEPKKIKNRIAILCDKATDPYDTYDYQDEVHQQYTVQPTYFFLVGNYASFDKNIAFSNEDFQHLIKKIVITNEIGLHPSYQSNSNSELLKEEKLRLESIINKNITKSRQHFLKLRFPQTYRNLVANGINEDYTMGYAEKSGFRASICSPYYFFDVEKNKVTALKIVPFCVMEAGLKYYQNCTVEEAIININKIVEIVKKVNGTFVSIWHNESLSDEGIWKGWRRVYEQMLLDVKKK